MSNKRFCIWERLMTASENSGFGPSRSSTRIQAQWSNLNSFAAEHRLLAAAADREEVRLKDFELHRPRQWGGCWLSASYGNNCNWMSFGEFDWVSVVKAPIGSTCSRHWFATGYWIRAVSGAFIKYGLSNRRWAICLAKTSRLQQKTLFIDVWIFSSNIKRNSLSFAPAMAAKWHRGRLDP